MDKSEQMLEVMIKMHQEMQDGFKDVNTKFDGMTNRRELPLPQGQQLLP